MARYEGGTAVPAGYYWNPRRWSFTTVGRDGERLPRGPGERYVRVHGAVALLAAPIVGGIFVVLLPFVGFAMLLQVLFGRLFGSAREGARDLAATLTPGWRPGEAHLTGLPPGEGHGEVPTVGAGESALKDVADEIARQRGSREDADG